MHCKNKDEWMKIPTTLASNVSGKFIEVAIAGSSAGNESNVTMDIFLDTSTNEW